MALLPEHFGDRVAGLVGLNGTIHVLGTSKTRAEGESSLFHLGLHPQYPICSPRRRRRPNPPHWARLKSDSILYTSLPEFRIPPPHTIFQLEPGKDKGDASQPVPTKNVQPSTDHDPPKRGSASFIRFSMSIR